MIVITGLYHNLQAVRRRLRKHRKPHQMERRGQGGWQIRLLTDFEQAASIASRCGCEVEREVATSGTSSNAG